jgi:hypothetical protein
MLLAKFGPSTNAGWDVVGGGSSSGSEGGGYPSWFSLLAPIGGLLAMGVIAALLYGKYNP